MNFASSADTEEEVNTTGSVYEVDPLLKLKSKTDIVDVFGTSFSRVEEKFEW